MYGMFATLKKLGKHIPLSSILLAFGVWKPTLFWVMAKSPCFPRVLSSHVVQMIPYAFGIWVIKWQITRFTSKYRVVYDRNNIGIGYRPIFSVFADISVRPIVKIHYRYRPIIFFISVALPTYYKIGWTTIFQQKCWKIFKNF